MIFSVLYKCVALVHAVWVLTVIAGVFIWPWMWFPWFGALILAMLASTVGSIAAVDACALTTLENALRKRAGVKQYTDGFMRHYARKCFRLNISQKIPLIMILLLIFTSVACIKFVINILLQMRK
ncbi:MAG: hypothetical protein UY09_C0017G0022 [Parcubacteria group bacterium GW2011_GWA2_47_8]|nr:MAG: hypothetical protein UY09_C0017G0022 [Parcubacteria group bacterium GW2011_GWA2_47_8]OHB20812.1 MAG: hypothetical protein A2666_04345 [Parcubacteria group bacterium RIFCSPHIGHO2_01_FULL_47_10b]